MVASDGSRLIAERFSENVNDNVLCTGDTIYFGGKTEHLFLVVYDKYLEYVFSTEGIEHYIYLPKKLVKIWIEQGVITLFNTVK